MSVLSGLQKASYLLCTGGGSGGGEHLSSVAQAGLTMCLLPRAAGLPTWSAAANQLRHNLVENSLVSGPWEAPSKCSYSP